ncbi:bifunctional folylpolyglutamate synthase/dihydrofolate synthase [Mycoplasma putrefaciens]|uniref:Folate synthetase-polyglutamyl folate synthetase n=1 Tax=Mycoplasma putrefaciens (strain ATCC 15718 / NCTC 10155 / C30 KS-1 / KS-1) TaxID=743965 RepID=A0A7U3ZS24_MYCPK|nr:Mur ligase family protein [Mycoplasma putrefaciens]AEM68497.1 folate synthetase-polyglutamyl folate synthetase [Mycoplasma putrefaciens KS1]
MILVEEFLFEWLTRDKSVDIFKEVLEELNHLEKKLPTINVVGTNGKGSTSFYISQGLKQKYQKVGLFISPAFIYHNERIQINNTPISDDDLKKYIKKAQKYMYKYCLNFFEMWTLIMIMYFVDNNVDIVVCEAGIGGYKDTTNYLANQILTAISSVSIDHTDFLGNTIQEIIFQKINIAKPNTKLIVSADNLTYQKIILDKLINRNVEVIFADKVADEIDYQQANKGLAKKVLEQFDIYDDSIFKLTKPLGRFSVLQTDPYYFVIDGAHNVDAIDRLITTTKKLEKNFIVLYASSSTKDYQTSLKLLNQSFDQVYITNFDHIKAWSIENIDYKNKVFDWETFLKNNNENILVCGSLYFIPQVYQWFESRKNSNFNN